MANYSTTPPPGVATGPVASAGKKTSTAINNSSGAAGVVNAIQNGIANTKVSTPALPSNFSASTVAASIPKTSSAPATASTKTVTNPNTGGSIILSYDSNGKLIGSNAVNPIGTAGSSVQPKKSYIGNVNATDNTNLINQGTAEQSRLIRDAIAAGLEVAANNRDNTLSNIASDRATEITNAENNYYKAIPQLNERLANYGALTGGGQSRQENLQLETDRINTQTTINNAANKLVNDANLAYNNLVAQGKQTEATQLAQIAGQKLSALLSESARLDTFNLNKAQAMTQEDQYNQTFDYNKSQDIIKNALQKSTIDGYMRNNAGDIEYDKNGVAQKTLAAINFDTEMAYKKDLAAKDFAFKQSELLGEVTSGLAALTGLPAGTLTSDQKYKNAQVDHNKEVLAEQIRSNKAQEGTAWYNAQTSRMNAETSRASKTQSDNVAAVIDWMSSPDVIPGQTPFSPANGYGFTNPNDTLAIKNFKLTDGTASSYIEKQLIKSGMKAAAAKKWMADERVAVQKQMNERATGNGTVDKTVDPLDIIIANKLKQ